MKKIKILGLLLLGLFFGLNYSNAGFLSSSIHSFYFSPNESNLNIQNYYTHDPLDGEVCLGVPTSSCAFSLNYQNNTISLDYGYLYCYDYHYPMVVSNTTSNRCPIFILFNDSDLSSFFGSYSGYVLETNVTENYCTNKFSNLIDESDITSSYCENQFNLIDPSDCPSSGGNIMWSSFWVNDRQILGGENIYLYIPDWLDWSYTYVDQDLQVDVVNEGDEDYIEDILTVQSYHPSSEDFTVSFVGFLTLVLPYVIVALFCIFVFKIIRKIFK